MKPRPSGLGAAPLVATGALVLVLGAPGEAHAAEAEVATAAEAWYRMSPAEEAVCGPAGGCPAGTSTPTSPYPDDTLHVESVSGRETARTYVKFDLASLPLGVELAGGTAVLPVADTDSGTVNAESAALRACLVTEPFTPVEGGTPSEAPTVDCETSAPAEFDADEGQPRFTVDLSVFAARWNDGAPDHGVALLADGSEGSGTWHLAFSGRDRDDEDAAPPITATVVYEEAPTAAFDGYEPVAGPTSPSAPGTTPGRATGGQQSLSAPSYEQATTRRNTDMSEPAPQVAPPQAVDAQTTGPTTSLAAGGLAKEAVWFLPLLLLTAAGGLARSLDGEVEVLAPDALPGLPVRLWEAFFPET